MKQIRRTERDIGNSDVVWLEFTLGLPCQFSGNKENIDSNCWAQGMLAISAQRSSSNQGLSAAVGPHKLWEWQSHGRKTAIKEDKYNRERTYQKMVPSEQFGASQSGVVLAKITSNNETGIQSNQNKLCREMHGGVRNVRELLGRSRVHP